MLSQQALGQNKYNIQLQKKATDPNTNIVCYEVQIKSANSQTWELAGQNYRLYYDGSKATFVSGQSLLGFDYQSFNLVQSVLNADASKIKGGLPFEGNLGFLNYSIDLLNPSIPGRIVPTGEEWLATTQLCFELEENATAPEFSIVWARNGKTEAYATSFVEISSRLGVNKTENTIGNNFLDILLEKAVQKVLLKAKVFLQGAFENELDDLMHDKLRALNYIPLKEPYSSIKSFSGDLLFKSKNNSGSTSTKAAILSRTGENAIVDWVFLELRDKNDPTKVKASKAALLQRNGAIIDVDGANAVRFDVVPDSYYVSIRHRNHLGVMTAEVIDLRGELEVLDFSNPSTKLYGENAVNEVNGRNLLWGGNTDSNEYLIFQGGGVGFPDSDFIFFEIFRDKKNIRQGYNHIKKGYSSSDVNMDGEVRYQGVQNDRGGILFFNIFAHPKNKEFYTNFFIKEQIPK
jgi:hypothetical protein